VVLKRLAGAGCLPGGSTSPIATVRLSPVLIGMRPESGAAEAVKAARAHVEMTSATVWRVRFLKLVSDFMVFPFFLIVWFPCGKARKSDPSDHLN
jgi:hypothetical protein